MPRPGSLSVLVLLALVSGCAVDQPVRIEWPALPQAVLAATEDADAKRRADARAAHAALRADPDEESAIIWYGRRLAYLGLYDAAIDIYTRGLKVHPRSARLLRHRGHRHLSKRDFAAAVADFERAVKLIDGQVDAIEPDGIPNARNTPTSSLHTNIWYHLGLARYCRGEFARALACYENGLQAVARYTLGQPRHDMEVATRYWKFLAAQRANDATAARSALAGIAADWDIIENRAYHRLLLLFGGKITREQVGLSTEDVVKNLTAAYGLARHRFLTGDAAAGREELAAIAAKESAAFGCIAAQADLARDKSRD